MTQDPYPLMIILRKHFPIAAVLHNGGGLGSLDQPKSETLSPDVLTSVLRVLGVLASRVGKTKEAQVCPWDDLQGAVLGSCYSEGECRYMVWALIKTQRVSQMISSYLLCSYVGPMGWISSPSAALA